MFASHKRRRAISSQAEEPIGENEDNMSEDFLPSQVLASQKSQSVSALRADRSQKRKLLTQRGQRVLAGDLGNTNEELDLSQAFTQSRFGNATENSVTDRNTYFDNALSLAGIKYVENSYSIGKFLFFNFNTRTFCFNYFFLLV